MKNIVNLFRLLSDETRMRIIMLLTKKELCVCQIMGVLGVSQPLVSRNLALLCNAGLLDERREGKLVFYRLKNDMKPIESEIVGILKRQLKNDALLRNDLQSLSDCTEFQKKTGKCDMKTFLEFMRKKRKQRHIRRKHAEAI